MYLAGSTCGNLDSQVGSRDPYLARYDRDGIRVWLKPFGSLPPIPSTAPCGVGRVANAWDCDDSNASVNPAPAELLDGLDNDCNGAVDDAVTNSRAAGASGGGCLAILSASAPPSATFSAPCVLQVAQVESGKSGLVFYGLDDEHTPWCALSSAQPCASRR